MNYLKAVFLCISCCIILSGCQGTGILLMPSEDASVGDKFKCSSAFLDGSWLGTYEKSKIEIDIKQNKHKRESCSATVWIYDKKKKKSLIPVELIAFQIKKNKYVLLVADLKKIVKRGDYSDQSLFLLYPIIKIFKLNELKNKKLSFQDVIFTKKVGKDKIVKLDPMMKMWGDNSNTIYGTSTEIISYLQTGKYRLSGETILTKTNEVIEKNK